MSRRARLSRGAGIILALALAVAPAAAAARAAGDPLEPLNRGLYALHEGLERYLLRPLLGLLLGITPNPVEKGVRNAAHNLGEPVTVVNDLLQLRVGAAARATGRFVTNSTLGVLGLFDVASDEGLAYHASDFGQTLGHYGVGPGPYLFVPLIGPSSVRDAGGRVADYAIDPVGRARFDHDGTVATGRTAASLAEQAERLPISDDPYAEQRELYLAERALPTGERERRLRFASVSASFFRPVE